METKTIRELTAYEGNWAIKARVVRKTFRETIRENSLDIMKIFLRDHEGSLVQAAIFNEQINKFYEAVENGKTYIIRNAYVKPVNKSADYVNDKIQLTFTNSTELEEIDEPIPYVKKHPYVNFNDIEKVSKGQRLMDIEGIVVKVKQIFVLPRKNQTQKLKKKREITLVDTMSNSIKLELWDDLAINEGALLESLVLLKPTIAALNVTINTYEGKTNLSTTFTSIIEISPGDEDRDAFLQSFEKLVTNGGGTEMLFGPSKRMIDAKEKSLADIILSNVNDKEFFCSFVGKVIKVLNKTDPWYAKSNCCNGRVQPFGNNKTVYCNTCKKENSTFTRFYMLKMVVAQGNEEVRATLFEAAEALTGCPVNYYAEKVLTEQDLPLVKEYKTLMLCEGKEFKFLVKMDEKNKQDRLGKKIIVEEVLKINKDSNDGGSSTNKRKLDN